MNKFGNEYLVSIGTIWLVRWTKIANILIYNDRGGNISCRGGGLYVAISLQHYHLVPQAIVSDINSQDFMYSGGLYVIILQHYHLIPQAIVSNIKSLMSNPKLHL